MGDLTPIVAIVMVFGGTVAVFWVVFSTIRRLKVARMQAEVHSKLIEKVGSSQDFLTFLETDSGKKLVASIGIEQPQPQALQSNSGFGPGRSDSCVLGVAFLVIGVYANE